MTNKGRPSNQGSSWDKPINRKDNKGSWGSARPSEKQSSWDSNNEIIKKVLNLHLEGKTPEVIFREVKGKVTLGTIRRWVNGEVPQSYYRQKNSTAGLFSSVVRSSPAHAGEQKQVVSRKGEKDIYDPYMQRCGIIYKVKSLKKRRAFPFNRSSIMPSLTELQQRYNILKAQGRPLHEYQKTGVQYLVSQSRCLLADGMGTGKTAQALAALPNNRIAGTIVVCPSSVRLGWFDEVKIWRPDLAVIVPPKKKYFKFPDRGEIVILGWDSLPTVVPDRMPTVPFVLVCDEAHYAKSEKTMRHKKIMHFVRMAQVVIGLTGTPMPNTVDDLWNVFRVCGMQALPKERMPLLGPRSRFGRTFFLWEKGNKRPVGAHNEIRAIIDDLTLRRTARDVCKELPPIRRKRVSLNPKPALVKRLDHFLSQCGGEQGLLNILEKAIEVHENGGDVDDYLMTLRVQIDMAKLPLLEEYVEMAENEGTSLVVFSPFRGPIEFLEKRSGWGAIKGGMNARKKKAVQDAFNNGMIKYLGITTAGATGVNLPGPDDNPCFKMIRTSLDWSPAINAQVIKRIDRVAKKLALGIQNDASLQIYDLYLDHKIDHMVWKTLGAKRMVLDSLGLKEDVEKSQGADPNYFNIQEAPDHHNVNIRFGGDKKQ